MTTNTHMHHEIGAYINLLEALDTPISTYKIWVKIGEDERLRSELCDELWEIEQKNHYWIIGLFRCWNLKHDVRRGDYILTLFLRPGKYHSPDINVVQGCITLSDGTRITVGRETDTIEPFGSYEGAFFPRHLRGHYQVSIARFYEMLKYWAKAQPHNRGRKLCDMTGFVELSVLYDFVKQAGMEM